MRKIEELANSDLGQNVYRLYELIKSNGVYVDCGIRHGVSSEIFLLDAEKNSNSVFGIEVDINFKDLSPDIKNHPNYKLILGESATIGKHWKGKINGLFIDTVHVKEQAMVELYYWYEKLLDGGFIGFHDTAWPEDKHDTHGGYVWDRVEDGIKSFFGIDELNYEDEFIKCSHYPESWGMTIIEIKKKKDYLSGKDWMPIFEARNKLINAQWAHLPNEEIKIELNMRPHGS